jgi:hypothetical protein
MRIYCTDGEENITIDGEGIILTDRLTVDTTGSPIPVIVKNFKVHAEAPPMHLEGFELHDISEDTIDFIHTP